MTAGIDCVAGNITETMGMMGLYWNMQGMVYIGICRKWFIQEHVGNGLYRNMQEMVYIGTCRKWFIQEHVGNGLYRSMQTCQITPYNYIIEVW